MNIDQLRVHLADLETRAKGKIAEITDDTALERAAAIEAEHAQMLKDIEATRAKIADAERAATAKAEEKRAAQKPVVAAADAIDETAVRAAAVASERQRISAIRQLGADFHRSAEFVQQHIEAGTDEAAFRSAILDAMRADSERHLTFGTVQNGVQDEGETARRGMVDAITFRLARAGGERDAKPTDQARPWAERELCEIAAECVGWRGQLRTSRQITEMFERAFHTTSDFPAIFTDAMSNRLLARYQTAEPTYRRWATRYVTPDFRPTNVIRAGDFPAPQPINQAGEIKHGTFGESKEQVQTRAYGIIMNLSRVMIVNDQLGAIDQVLGSYGVRIADWENAFAYEVLLQGSGDGPVLLTDSKRVFHTDHANKAGTPSIIDIANVGIGRAALAKQTTLDGIKANFQAATLLTGPDKQTQAEQLLTSITPALIANAVPESLRRLVPVSDANIPGNYWYLFADPSVAPCFVYSYLEGFEGPRLSSEDVFDVQGMRVKVEHDFGFGGIDFRGAFRNAGA